MTYGVNIHTLPLNRLLGTGPPCLRLIWLGMETKTFGYKGSPGLRQSITKAMVINIF